MFMRTLTAATLLAAVLPGAMAAQTTITTTTQGVITENSWRQNMGIHPGESFELTSVMRFDPIYVVQEGPNKQRVFGSADYTLKVADRTYQFSSRTDSARMYYEAYRSHDGELEISLILMMQDYYRLTFASYTYDPFTPPQNLLTSGSYEYTYASPFETQFSMREYAGVEPTGDIETDITSFHILVSSVPEPATYAMLGAGLGLIALSRRKRRKETETSPA